MIELGTEADKSQMAGRQRERTECKRDREANRARQREAGKEREERDREAGKEREQPNTQPPPHTQRTQRTHTRTHIHSHDAMTTICTEPHQNKNMPGSSIQGKASQTVRGLYRAKH